MNTNSLPVTHSKGAVPDVGLAEEGAHFLVVRDFLEKISAVGVLCDDTQTSRRIVVEGLLVSDHVLVLHGREQPDLGAPKCAYKCSQCLRQPLTILETRTDWKIEILRMGKKRITTG